ncbi:putative short-subunit dehydrogenase-like oxidoreductase (DUF2520 family) [Lewinella aquimaris]|uniref:Putative short-subunit dehydrogenase-like oxidoreductase (DUF2520 family) n=1 Tax=Neolewinella aquimaris TaxID=1835722 RepID=A0A840DWU9_9BACT|nr:Rossmann-like and DUF2520 domain-containing protein [Neolewinella aquimaris]MBB4077481.1 putative short-subunit dehydrogenase-like oxidoreductase (DUF2520 family) [Neolewinella aquimaris]
MPETKIAIVGSGNLAWHLAAVLDGPGVVVSRSNLSSTDWPLPVIDYDQLARLRPATVVLAVPDNRIGEVSDRLAEVLPATTTVYHTSGATPVDRISSYFRHRGVLWPIRSLRRGDPVTDWRDLPLVIYATDEITRDRLTSLAAALSDTVAYLDDAQRAQLHLAAVFSNNFVTALYEIAYQLCHQHHIPFDLLLPIIRKTAEQQDGSRPADRQTGAAARNDTITMQRHLDLLSDARYEKLYRDLSRLILQYRLPKDDLDLRRDPDDDF